MECPSRSIFRYTSHTIVLFLGTSQTSADAPPLDGVIIECSGTSLIGVIRVNRVVRVVRVVRFMRVVRVIVVIRVVRVIRVLGAFRVIRVICVIIIACRSSEAPKIP